LLRLARSLQTLGRSEGVAPDIVQRSADACQSVAKSVISRLAAERGARACVHLDDLGPLLTLPGVGAHGDLLVRHIAPLLSEASLPALLAAVPLAKAADAPQITADIADAILRRLCQGCALPTEIASSIQALATSGVLLDRCAAVLERHAVTMETHELTSTIIAFAEKSHESNGLASACLELSTRCLGELPSRSLLGMAVAATKSASLTACVGNFVNAAVAVLATWPAADAIRLLLATTKAKGDAITQQIRCALLREAASAIAPHLPELPAVELVRLALAAGAGVSEQGASSLRNGEGGGGGEAVRLLEAVAAEARRRLSDLPQAHLLLLTQGLAPLGGAHDAIREICGFWGEALRGDNGVTDEVSRRRKELERGQALTADQLVKLAAVLGPLGRDLDDETAKHCFGGIGARLLELVGSLQEPQRNVISEQLRRKEGVGIWEDGRQRLARALQKKGSNHRDSRSRSRSRSSAPGQKKRAYSSSSSRSGGRRSNSKKRGSTKTRGSSRERRRSPKRSRSKKRRRRSSSSSSKSSSITTGRADRRGHSAKRNTRTR